MGTTIAFLVAGASLVFLAWRGFPLRFGASRKSNDETRRQHATERFVTMLNPIRNRIAAERGNHRTLWVRSRMEIGNACQVLRPHLDDQDVDRLDAAYQRFKCIPEEAFRTKPAGNASDRAGSWLDHTAVKHVMLESIREMTKIATARSPIQLMAALSTN
jgi:hypothetical protein